MKILKWLIISVLVLVAILAGLIFFAPTLFGDRIRTAVDAEIAHFVDADVTYGDVDLSLLRSFPQLTVGIDDIVVEGRGRFDSVRLAELAEFAVSVDFWSALSDGPVAIHGVYLDQPKLQVMTLADGTTNTDILRNLQEASTAASEPSASIDVQLEHYEITDGSILYDDRSAGVYLKATGLNHAGSGDFTSTTYDLDTETTIEALDMVSGGVTYIRQASLNYDAVLEVNTESNTVTLSDNTLNLNELQLSANGQVGIPGGDGSIPVDVSFVAPKQDFRALWSVIPAAFTKDLTGLKTSGSFSLNGTVDGTYIPEPASLPAFAVDLKVNEASVQYPDLPEALTGINAVAGIRSSGRDLSDLLIDIEQFAFQLGANPFSGRLRVKQGLTDPAFDLAAKGKLNLATLSKAIPIEGVTTLAGLVNLDVEAAGTASGAQSDLRSLDSKGVVEVKDIVYVAEGTPEITVARGRANFDGQDVLLRDMAIQAGASDILLSGKLTDPFAVVTSSGTLGGNLTARGRKLDANEWIAEPAAASTTGSAETTVAPAAPFERFALNYDVAFDEVNYDVYDLNSVVAAGSISPEQLRIKNGSATLDGSKMNMSGELSNLYGFAFDDEELTGNLSLKAGTLDLLKLAETGTDPASAAAASGAAAGYVELPENMSIRIATSVDKLLYDDIELENVSGIIAMANQGAVIENGKAGILGGQLAIDGGYQYLGESTPPTFDLKYDLKQASFKQAFEQLNTVKQLAPVAQFLSGNFNTNLVMSSSLGPDMLPNLKDLDADGFIATLNATLNDFAPLQKAANLLNVKELRSLDLKNTKNWFTIQDGTVEVRPFDVKWNGIDATIGGSHGLDQAMDYEIIALIPREMLGKNAVGDAVNTGLDFLNGQASKLGLNLNAGEFVRVRIGMTGSMTEPKVAVKLLGTEGEGSIKDAAGAAIKDLAQQARDSIERVAQAKLDAAKAQAEAKARAVADSVRSAAETRARAAADEAKAKAKAEADRLAQKAIDEAKAKAAAEAKKAAEDAAKKAGDDAAEKAKDALKGIFKKKKPDER